MISNSHPTEFAAMKHMHDLQHGDNRFATMCPNAEIKGEWLVTYEPEPSRIDIDALKAAQAII